MCRSSSGQSNGLSSPLATSMKMRQPARPWGLRWTMELMGWFDGAMVRLGTLTAEVDMSARFTVGSAGGVSLQTTGVEVISVYATGGLLEPADDTEADQLAASFATELVDSIPLWTLPRVGDFAPTEAKFIAPYLMFTDG